MKVVDLLMLSRMHSLLRKIIYICIVLLYNKIVELFFVNDASGVVSSICTIYMDFANSKAKAAE